VLLENTMANSLAFKCYLSFPKQHVKEIRRFSLDSDVIGNFTYLQEKIRFTYPQLLRESFTLHYIDMEEDEVSISSDDELVTALMFVNRKDCEPFRLFIQLGGSTTELKRNYLGDTHFGITCDGCAGQVSGFRYKCLQCEDYDLCGKCEAGGAHPEHCFIRVPGPLPSCFTSMKKLLEGSKIPRHHHRSGMYRGGPKSRGRCGFAFPGGISVEIDPKFSEELPKQEEKPCNFAGASPFSFDPHSFEAAAKAFQDIATSEHMQNIGHTISTILGQFGVPAQQPEPNCPSGCFKPKGEEAKTHKATEEEEKGEAAATAGPGTTSTTNPYAPLVEAAIAVDTATAAAPRMKSSDSVDSVEETIIPIAPRDSDEWTMIEKSKKESRASSPNDLGARPKAPAVLVLREEAHQEEACSDASDPKIDDALKTMLTMGFTNEGGWLAQLLRVKNGDIGKVLDVLNSQFQRQ